MASHERVRALHRRGHTRLYAPVLQALTELIESVQVRLVIDRTYPLSQAPEAIQYMRDGHAGGKVVVDL